MSKLTDVLSEIAYPVREPAVLLAIVVFFALLSIAAAGGALGLFLLLLTLPALFRYLTLVLTYRARGQDAEPPTAEIFQLFESWWSLFPLPLIVAFAGFQYFLLANGHTALVLPTGVAFAALFPAFLGVLAITHSPIESLKPTEWLRLISRCGPIYWLAPVVLVVLNLAYAGLAKTGLPSLLVDFVYLYMHFAIYAMIGGVLRTNNLIDDVDIPDAVEPDEDTRVLQTKKMRTEVLTHAYGIISRGNMDNGMEHIYQALDIDAEPDDAWRWYQDQMFRWENTYPGLLLAQQHLHRLLAFDDAPGALKLLTRCRHANADFKPLSHDVPKALEMAQKLGHQELVDYLQALR